MPDQEAVSAAYWKGVAQAKENTLNLQAVEFKQRESRWLARIAELEAERASWLECYMGAVRTMEEGVAENDKIMVVAREMRDAAQYGKSLARIDAEHASWPKNRVAGQRFLNALKAWDDLMVTLPEPVCRCADGSVEVPEPGGAITTGAP